MISDMVLLNDLPEKIRNNVLAYVGCIAGAEKKEDYLNKIKQAGFEQVQVVSETNALELMVDEPDIKALIEELELTKAAVAKLSGAVVSIKVSAVKP